MGNSPVFALLLKMVPFCFPVAGNAVHAVASSHACQCQPIVRKSIGMIAEYESCCAPGSVQADSGHASLSRVFLLQS